MPLPLLSFWNLSNLVGGVMTPPYRVLFWFSRHILDQTAQEVWIWVCV